MLFSAVGTVLHGGEAVTGLVYVGRVLVHLVAFAAFGIALFGASRAIEIVRSGRSKPDDDPPPSSGPPREHAPEDR